MTSIPEPLREKLEEFEKWSSISSSGMANTALVIIGDLKSHIEMLEKKLEVAVEALVKINDICPHIHHEVGHNTNDQTSYDCLVAKKALRDIESLVEKTE